ncbi:hypothetical protein N1851_018800 [Merluccius polli]|nr:hypothetical protein N1851_018800 [Merluccius polli]
MVKAFPGDYMHQCCLGVMRKLLLLWTRVRTEVRMSRAQIAQVNNRLIALRKVIPTCFARRPRSLDELDRWKATEFRQFMLYTGKVVLRGILQENLFDHFMTFSTAMCILVSPELAVSHTCYAHNLLQFFVDRGGILYGPQFKVYNVHSLLHLAADVTSLGSLDHFSAFPFESHLHHIKNMVRSGKNPLMEIANRLEETIPMKLPETRPENMVKEGAVFILSPGECCEVVSLTDNAETVLCRVYTNLQSYLLTPCDSRIYGAFRAKTRASEMRLLHRSCLVKLAFVIKEPHGHRVVVTVLHTI